MSMSAATIVHAEDEVTLRVLNWGNTDEEKIANDAIARFNEENPNVKVEQTCVPVEFMVRLYSEMDYHVYFRRSSGCNQPWSGSC